MQHLEIVADRAGCDEAVNRRADGEPAAAGVLGNDSDVDGNLATVTINPVNDAPILQNVTMDVVGGGTVLLIPSMFSATDVDDADSTLVFTITNVQHGRFEHIDNPGQSLSSFDPASRPRSI